MDEGSIPSEGTKFRKNFTFRIQLFYTISMKNCTRCHQEKETFDFSWKNKLKGKLSPHCKICQRLLSKAHHKNNINYYREKAKRNNSKYRKEAVSFIKIYLLEHPCIDCGNSDIRVLEFDHVRGIKKNAISKMVTSASPLGQIKLEIEKCEVRCANCHRIKTIKQLGWTSRKLD